MANISDIVAPVLTRECQYISNLQFISNNRSQEIIICLANQPKVNYGTMNGLNECFTIDSLRNAESQTPGYTPMGVHQHYLILSNCGSGKTAPVEYLAGPYKHSRGLVLKYAFRNGVITANDHQKYKNAMDYKDKEIQKNSQSNSANNSNDISLIYSENSNENNDNNNSENINDDDFEDIEQQNDDYINNIICEIDSEFAELQRNRKINIETQKMLLCSYKKSTYVNAVRSRRLQEDVARRGGNGIGYYTEYSQMVSSFESDKNAFSLLWCIMGDNKINASDFTGKKYCIKSVEHNQFNFLSMGTIKDLLDFIGRIDSGAVSRTDVYILPKVSRYFYQHKKIQIQREIAAKWAKYQAALQILSLFEPRYSTSAHLNENN